MGLMTVPLIGVLFFTILPLIYVVCLAFTNFDHNHPAPKSLFDWVGFTTFSQVLEGRMAGTFFPLLTWTLIWAVAATATTFFFGIVLALLINTKGLKFKKVWRTLFVITIAVPQFVSLLLMRNFLNDDGPLNGLLQTFHITNGPLPFLTDPLWAKFSIIFVNMWIGIPFTMLVATGIIMNLPTEQIEAAEIDGASKFQIFKSITFPQILLIMTPSLIQQFIELIEENRSKVNHYFQTVFRTFLRHKQYIQNALETDYSNAKLEATNKLIKDIKRLGFGFRNFINFKKRVFITLNIHKKRTYPVLSRC